ncbi:hypothetical protein RDI58_007620 [Solanum bulbocastanum]|uniref:Uncharacterized protein n=1 Tax=Solanum bulbocastanum TaxID=147425 RepID=A0AAN8U1N6_SOLBU
MARFHDKQENNIYYNAGAKQVSHYYTGIQAYGRMGKYCIQNCKVHL